jgi:hypothetical protein
MIAWIKGGKYRRTYIISAALLIAGLCCLFLFYELRFNPMSSSARFKLTEAQLVENAKLALAGDVTAARKLTNYYGFFEYDESKFHYWVKVGAVNGDQNLQYFHASNLLTQAETTTDAALRAQLIKEAIQWADLLTSSGSVSNASSLKENIKMLQTTQLIKK